MHIDCIDLAEQCSLQAFGRKSYGPLLYIRCLGVQHAAKASPEIASQSHANLVWSAWGMNWYITESRRGPRGGDCLQLAPIPR